MRSNIPRSALVATLDTYKLYYFFRCSINLAQNNFIRAQIKHFEDETTMQCW
jgi:hypothetical protein